MMDCMPVIQTKVDEKLIKKMCANEYDEFMSRIDKSDTYDFDDIARTAISNELSDYIPDIEIAYAKLQKAFKKATGLMLSLQYHNSNENGSRYDDINGGFWIVDGVYMKTPAAKKYKQLS